MSIKDIVYALIVNIALLAIIANTFIQDPDSAKIDSAGKKRVERRSDIINDFRRLIILSTCIGVKITSYSLNTRVIGAMSAGLLGGPLVGLYSSAIGAIYVLIFSTPRVFARGSAFATILFDCWEQDSTLIFKEASGNIRICSCWHVLQKSVTWHPCFA